MGRMLELTGKRYGRLEVIEKWCKNNRNDWIWLCKCDCGNTTLIIGSDLKSGNSKSCGCIRKEKTKEMARKHNTIHGESRTRLYTIWGRMINRTTNENDKDYKRYGGRGIAICDEWKDFLTFKQWALENGYSDNLTIDRIDNDKGYEPCNCRWATRREQNNNQLRNWKIECAGKTQTLEQWAEEYNIRRQTLGNRLKNGWTVEKALTTSVVRGKGKGYKRKKSRKSQ